MEHREKASFGSGLSSSEAGVTTAEDLTSEQKGKEIENSLPVKETKNTGKVASPAFKRELDRCYPRLLPLALSLTRNREDAEDLLHDSFVKALKSPSGFQIGTNMQAWLSTILKHTFYSDHRKKQTSSRYSAREVLNGIRATEPEQENILLLGQALALVEKLPDEQRQALTSRALHGIDYDRAAEILHASPGTIKSRVSRARACLRRETD